MSLEIPDVRLGEPDLRPTAARMAYGATREYRTVEHRAALPPAVSVERESRPPQSRAAASSPGLVDAARNRRDRVSAADGLLGPAFRVENGVPEGQPVPRPRPSHRRQWE